jgi:hypothetical protein
MLSPCFLNLNGNVMHVFENIYRVVIVCLQEKIAGLDAFTLTKKFGITSKFDSTSSEYYATFLEVIICTNFKPKFVIKIIGCY